MKTDVTIILCTHKYVKYAKQQIISIKNQINVNINLVVSIDSNDISIIKKWTDLVGTYFSKDNYIILKGPQKGFSSNFINAIIKSNSSSEYMAFSDHDDIWDNNKLYEAIKCIEKINKRNTPILYGSRTRYIDENDKFLTLSNTMKKSLGFKNSLVQCFAGGNTMVFNRNLFLLIKKIGFVDVSSHDWWLYIIASAVDGKIIYDKNSYVSYRQHQNNIIGGNKGALQSAIRIKRVMLGEYKAWNKNNIYYLIKNKEMISPASIKILSDFIKIQNGNFFERFFYFFRSGIYRQTFFGNVAIFIFTLFKKI